ncbi:Imm1 family immunity protein [Amycolatopsis sp. CA-128772]|uniref:Imm1 family immunity protein n=1 Tax=Amycolatopsis sp. CA-128772 TaxID=2073159 RepID=UPI000CD1FFAA|nr:Imm1 family immunity protein [Amycolatopsis sp. CA-128772]
MVEIEAWYDPGQAEPLSLREPSAVDELLDRMVAESTEAELGVIAEVARRGDDRWAILQIGVRSSACGFVGYAGPDGSVISASGATSPVLVAYDYQNHEREIPSTAEVPLAAVRKALHEFVASDGARPAGVTWQNL